jgi:hypothetical protein
MTPAQIALKCIHPFMGELVKRRNVRALRDRLNDPSRMEKERRDEAYHFAKRIIEDSLFLEDYDKDEIHDVKAFVVIFVEEVLDIRKLRPDRENKDQEYIGTNRTVEI